RLAERRSELVLHDLDLGAVAHRLGALLERFDATDVHANRGVELERAPAGGGLGRVVHDDSIGEIGVVALDLQIEAMGMPPTPLVVLLVYGDGYHTELPPSRKSHLAGLLAFAGVPSEAAAARRMELVVEGRMKVRRDEFMQTGGLLGVKPEPTTVVTKPPEPARLERRDHRRPCFT